MAYSQDLRDRVLRACDRGMPTKNVAEVFDVSRAWVRQGLRSLGCRTRETLWNRIQSVIDTVSDSDAEHCFAHCGYTLRKN